MENKDGEEVKKEDKDEEMPEEGAEKEKQEVEKKPKEISPELAKRADELLGKRDELKEGNIKSAACVALSAAAVKAKVRFRDSCSGYAFSRQQGACCSRQLAPFRSI